MATVSSNVSVVEMLPKKGGSKERHSISAGYTQITECFKQPQIKKDNHSQKNILFGIKLCKLRNWGPYYFHNYLTEIIHAIQCTVAIVRTFAKCSISRVTLNALARKGTKRVVADCVDVTVVATNSTLVDICASESHSK